MISLSYSGGKMLFSNKINFENIFYFIKKMKNDLTQKKILKQRVFTSEFLSLRLLPPPFTLNSIVRLTFIILFSFKVWAVGEMDALKKELDTNPENLKVRH